MADDKPQVWDHIPHAEDDHEEQEREADASWAMKEIGSLRRMNRALADALHVEHAWGVEEDGHGNPCPTCKLLERAGVGRIVP